MRIKNENQPDIKGWLKEYFYLFFIFLFFVIIQGSLANICFAASVISSNPDA